MRLRQVTSATQYWDTFIKELLRSMFHVRLIEMLDYIYKTKDDIKDNIKETKICGINIYKHTNYVCVYFHSISDICLKDIAPFIRDSWFGYRSLNLTKRLYVIEYTVLSDLRKELLINYIEIKAEMFNVKTELHYREKTC